MKKLALSMLLAATAAPAVAQAPLPDADPAMWVVKDADTTVYLFGTFHLLDGKQDWFNDEVKAAFDKSDELVLEAIIPENPAEMQPLVVKYALDMSGRKLSDKIGPEVKAALDKVLVDAGMPKEAAQGFEMLDPWFISMTLTALSAQKMGLSQEHGPETIIKKAADAKGIKVGELEGAEWQLKMFDEMPEDKQVKMLSETVAEVDKIEETLAPMMSAWSTGDTEGLVKIMNEGVDDDPDLYKMLFSNRNARWADWVETRLAQPGTVFVAVGAGHLAGKDSVQDYLAKKGVKSARVTE